MSCATPDFSQGAPSHAGCLPCCTWGVDSESEGTFEIQENTLIPNDFFKKYICNNIDAIKKKRYICHYYSYIICMNVSSRLFYCRNGYCEGLLKSCNAS